jgi:hypothetical protein
MQSTAEDAEDAEDAAEIQTGLFQSGPFSAYCAFFVSFATTIRHKRRQHYFANALVSIKGQSHVWSTGR